MKSPGYPGHQVIHIVKLYVTGFLLLSFQLLNYQFLIATSVAETMINDVNYRAIIIMMEII